MQRWLWTRGDRPRAGRVAGARRRAEQGRHRWREAALPGHVHRVPRRGRHRRRCAKLNRPRLSTRRPTSRSSTSSRTASRTRRCRACAGSARARRASSSPTSDRSASSRTRRCPGDAKKGADIYRSLGCASCHIVGGQGGNLGPDLSDIGFMRGAAYLRAGDRRSRGGAAEGRAPDALARLRRVPPAAHRHQAGRRSARHPRERRRVHDPGARPGRQVLLAAQDATSSCSRSRPGRA